MRDTVIRPNQEVGMSFKVAHRDDCETNGRWELTRRTLDLQAFGINIVNIAPGDEIPEHDETGRDQEEVFFVISGNPTLVIDGTDCASPTGTFARIDPEHRRAARNDGEQIASILIASAPRTSGYEPMSWA